MPTLFNSSFEVLAGVVPIGLLILYALKKYFNGPRCNIRKDLTGKIVVITGANTGIGKETATVLAGMGATVIIGCRDVKRSKAALEDIKALSKSSQVEFIQLDLADTKSIRSFADEFKKRYSKLDILINNAGIMALVNREVTKDGFEMQFGVNHLGHFLLTYLLVEPLKAAAPSRVVVLASMAYSYGKLNWEDLMGEKTYHFFNTYGHSKLSNILFARKFSEVYEKHQIKAVSLHPGAIRTELQRNYLNSFIKKLLYTFVYPVWWFMTKDVSHGAQTTLYCALEDYDKLVGGAYYSDCKVKQVTKLAQNVEDTDRLWVESHKLLNLPSLQ